MLLPPEAFLLLVIGMLAGGAAILPIFWRQSRRMRRVEAQSRRIATLARQDTLTGLPNRTEFNHRLHAAISRAKRESTSLAVFAIDLENMREINHSLGSAAGDTLLRTVAERLTLGLRAEDLVARIGGDAFAIIQDGGDQPASAGRLARRLASLLAAPYTLGGQPATCRANIGVVVADSSDTSADALLSHADHALDRAKAEGKGVAFFEPAMDAALHGRRQLEVELREAILLKSMTLHWQPAFSLPGCRLLACEALLRWQHPTRGLLNAGEFMAIAEETGLIVPLCRWTLRTACKEAVTWEKPISVAVNLSPAQFRHDDIVDAVRNALAASGLDPKRLEIEVTEGLLARNAESALQQIQSLRALGVKVVLDDFGAGAASLGHLVRFPFDRLKLERSFTAALNTDPRAVAVTEAICALGRRLDIEVAAAGVETEGELAMLADFGFIRAQGYLLGRPQPAGNLPALFKSSVRPLPESLTVE